MLCVLILIFNSSVAYSADVDGIFSADEWDGAVVAKIFEGESNCGVNFALVHTMIDSENSALFLCFMHKDSSLEYDNTVTGVSLLADGSDYFDVTVSDSPAYSDSSEHSFEGCVTVDKNNGATTEIRIGFKYGLPKEIECTVRFIDSVGALSNVYDFTVVNDEFVEATEMIITQDLPEETEKEKTVRAEKTTKSKKSPTEKRTTRKSSKTTTDKLIAKITQENETRRKSTYSRRVRTTKPRTTAVSDNITAAPKPATVYYYEKEVIISQVYITQTEATSFVETTQEAKTVTTSEQANASIVTETEIKSSFSLSEGAKKKALVGVFAAISFTVIAAAGTRSSKKKTDDNDNPESR